MPSLQEQQDVHHSPRRPHPEPALLQMRRDDSLHLQQAGGRTGAAERQGPALLRRRQGNRGKSVRYLSGRIGLRSTDPGCNENCGGQVRLFQVPVEPAAAQPGTLHYQVDQGPAGRGGAGLRCKNLDLI